jgi:cytidylate kinase
VGKLLAQELGFTYWAAGDAWREEAAKLGMTLNEFHEHLQRNPEYDRALDAQQAALGTRERIVIDSRLGFHFVPHAFKVYLSVEPSIAAERLVGAKRAREVALTAADALAEIVTRREHERAQHQSLYGIDSHDHANFNLVVDTSELAPDAVVAAIIAALPKR